ncbi:MAG: D,D-dipeptide ABC transporter permease, partial [Pseudomonadota bacterium]
MAERLSRNLVAALRRDLTGIGLLAMVAILVAMCLMAPWITNADPTATDFANMLLPPSLEHPLGTDDFGRDVFARLLYGGQASLSIAAVAVMVVTVIGVTVGIVAGYFG